MRGLPLTIGLFRESRGAEAPPQLGVDPLRRDLVVAEQDQQVEDQVGGLAHHLLRVPPLAGHGHFGGFLADLAENLVETLGIERGDVGLFARIALPLEDDPVDCFENVVVFGHGFHSFKQPLPTSPCQGRRRQCGFPP